MCFVNGYEIQRAMARRAEDSTCFFFFPPIFQHNLRIDLNVET